MSRVSNGPVTGSRAALTSITWQREGDLLPDHLGLAYERLAPLKGGKVPDELRGPWLAALASSFGQSEAARSAYERYFARWKASLADSRTRQAEVTTGSRLLIGQGNGSAVEVGLTLHRTYGVPMIPGSALKGLLAHYLEACYGPSEEDARHPMDPERPDAARASFQGPTMGQRMVHGPGERFRTLFGAPDAESDETMRLQLAREDIGAAKGGVIFHDALMVWPQSSAWKSPIAADVLTVHQKSYYDAGMRGSSGEASRMPWPNDYDAPNPVSFLSVSPGTSFLIALSGEAGPAEFALKHLLEALKEWGVGGKTGAGYGWMKTGKVFARPESGIAAELETWLAEQKKLGTLQGEVLREVQARWLTRLLEVEPHERIRALHLLRGVIKSPKWLERRDQILRVLEQTIP